MIQFDRTTKNCLWLSLAVLIQSLQVLVIVVLIYSFIPIKLSPITDGVMPQLLQLFKPEREITFYRIWIAFAFGAEMVALWFWRKQLDQAQLGRLFKNICFIDGAWITLQILYAFRLVQYPEFGWPRVGLYVCLVGALISKMFYPELLKLMDRLHIAMQEKANAWGMIVLSAGIFIALLWIPNIEAAVARIFMIDRFGDLNQWIVTPLTGVGFWLKAGTPALLSLHTGMELVIGAIVAVLGGLTYAHVLVAMVVLSLLYYIAVFYFSRQWLESDVLALAITLLLIKVQLFSYGIEPLVWAHPSHTPIAHLCDVFVFACLWRYLKDNRIHNLWYATGLMGFALIYAGDTGICLYIAFISVVWLSKMRQWQFYVLPLALWSLVALICVGFPGIVRFFQDQYAHIVLSTQGLNALPITDPLHSRQFFAFCAGLFLPCFYAGICAYSAIGVILNALHRRYIFICGVAVYALCDFVFFVHHSFLNQFYAHPLALVVLIGFVIKESVNRQPGRDWIQWGMLVAVAIGLWTNILFTVYPNLFNVAHQNFQAEIDAYHALDLKKDVAIIDQVTQPTDPVAVLGAFDTQILIDAHRAPFFKESLMRPFEPRSQQVGLLALSTKDDVLNVINTMENARPSYFFMDKNVYSADALYTKNGAEGTSTLLTYIKSHYSPYAVGQMYIALKLKPNA